MLDFIKGVNNCLSDYVLVLLLTVTGIFFTLKTRFVQVRCFKEGLSNTFGGIFSKGKKSGGVTSFQALATSVAAQVGTGNIVGACGAILTGGPGAIFWMWVIAFFGMATIYAEAVLAQETKVLQDDCSVAGGPVFYIRRAFSGPFGSFLCRFFSLATVIALGFTGTAVQANSMAEACKGVFPISSYAVGVIIAVLAGFIFRGGVKTVTSVTEKLVPIMAFLYLLGGFIVIAFRIKYLPQAIIMIFKYAFLPDAVIGGSIGYALKTVISQGVKRGLFSNEAGMGSTPHAHALADVKKPHDQGVAAMTGVFIDTFCVLTVTGLVIIITLYAGQEMFPPVLSGIDKNNMASYAFGKVFGERGSELFICVSLLLFAFSSVIGWNYFGRINFEYLFGKRLISVYNVICLAFIFLGSVMGSDFVWECADLFNQLMVIPNLLALVLLSPLVKRAATENIHK